ncbi:MAG: hypothetical protein VKK62_01015 [Synechococcaceae cyanobacterium]|nr:hypothetical protein [Synechococcaceae cyanobacterium]
MSLRRLRLTPRVAGRALPLAALAVGSTVIGASLSPAAGRAGMLADTVRGLCLSAFHQEMSKAGKVPPAGMADFACSCVTERIVDGSSLDAARQSCRLATTRRYPL